jgi:hypothetical protein
LSDSLKKLSWLWPLAFLALPNCALDSTGHGTGGVTTHFNPGDPPFDSAIFCDIEDITASPHCASPDEVNAGVPLTQAAIDLTLNQKSNIGLDYSPAAISAHGCSPGQPVAITFQGPFPDGAQLCLNCGSVMPSPYPDPSAACVDRCKDLNDGADDFCASHAHTSTNAPDCVGGACTDESALTDFDNKRRTPEPVIWDYTVDSGTSGADDNTLTRNVETVPGFNAGASSKMGQTITHGDGYVEFTVAETDKARVCGFSTGEPPDLEPGLADIGFGIRLSAAGGVVIEEGGALITNGGADFAPYAPGDRLRVSVADNFDGTANVTYSLIPAACAGPACNGMVLRTATGAAYPLRVDASLKELGASLVDVRIVRIK